MPELQEEVKKKSEPSKVLTSTCIKAGCSLVNAQNTNNSGRSPKSLYNSLTLYY